VALINQRQTGIIRIFKDTVVMVSASGELFSKSDPVEALFIFVNIKYN